MPTDGGSQFESLWDGCAAALFNVYDGYGWIVPALLLTLLFFLALALLCWWAEDVFVEPMFQGPSAIFRWCRHRWKPQRSGVIISIVPSQPSPSQPPPSSALE
jgi:hypothetical protein